jgi:prepilin-type N-terminal cleavage/methylation domain-containing protein
MSAFRQPRPGPSEAGFTLIELMISIIVLSVGLLGLASAMASMTRFQELANARAEMSFIAEGKFEQLRHAASNRTIDTLQLATGGSLVAPSEYHADTTVGRAGRCYARLWQVVPGPGGTRDVTLRIQPLVDEPRTPARLDFKTLILTL